MKVLFILSCWGLKGKAKEMEEVDPNSVTHKTRGRIEGEQKVSFY